MSDVNAEIAEIMSNPDYTNEDATVRGPLVDRVMELRLLAENPDAKAEPLMPREKPDAHVGDGLDAKTADFLTAPALPEDISFGALNDSQPEGFVEDPEMVEQCRNWAYAMEVPQPQMDGLIRLYCDAITWDENRLELEGRQAIETLAQKYGDKAEQALKIANSAARSAGGEYLLNFLDTSGLGNRYEVIQMLIDHAARKGVHVHDQ